VLTQKRGVWSACGLPNTKTPAGLPHPLQEIATRNWISQGPTKPTAASEGFDGDGFDGDGSDRHPCLCGRGARHGGCQRCQLLQESPNLSTRSKPFLSADAIPALDQDRCRRSPHASILDFGSFPPAHTGVADSPDS